MTQNAPLFDRSAAVTRSLLGWGVVAGPFYVVIGLVLAVTRPGFDLTQHAVSLLTLGEHGWMQRVNFIVSALMTLAAAYGILRTVRNGRGLAIGTCVAVYGACLILSAFFLPDPAAGFPTTRDVGTVTTHGILHLVFGAIGFLSLSIGAFASAKWAASRQARAQFHLGLWCGLVVVLGFIGGAVFAQAVVGVVLLWLAVLAGWAWLAFASAHLYTVVPHPVIAQRTQED